MLIPLRISLSNSLAEVLFCHDSLAELPDSLVDFLARFPSGFSLFVRLPSGAFVTFASKRFTTVQQFNNSAFHQFIISSNQQFSSLVGARRCKSFCRHVSQFTFQFLLFCSLLWPLRGLRLQIGLSNQCNSLKCNAIMRFVSAPDVALG